MHGRLWFETIIGIDADKRGTFLGHGGTVCTHWIRRGGDHAAFTFEVIDNCPKTVTFCGRCHDRLRSMQFGPPLGLGLRPPSRSRTCDTT